MFDGVLEYTYTFYEWYFTSAGRWSNCFQSKSSHRNLVYGINRMRPKTWLNLYVFFLCISHDQINCFLFIEKNSFFHSIYFVSDRFVANITHLAVLHTVYCVMQRKIYIFEVMLTYYEVRNSNSTSCCHTLRLSLCQTHLIRRRKRKHYCRHKFESPDSFFLK